MDDQEQDDLLFRCAICGVAEGDSSNLTSQNTLQTNATVRCGHQLYVSFCFCFAFVFFCVCVRVVSNIQYSLSLSLSLSLLISLVVMLL